ncbi:MAG TPA: carboxypeptidase regulatory-like domain-containing protein [Terriglobales bacterium]
MFIRNTFAGRRLTLMSCLAILALCTATSLWAQSNIANGSIQGTVTDPNGAVVPGAAITISNKTTATAVKATSTSSGTYASGALQPGVYDVRVTSKGFRTAVLSLTVQVGTVTSGDIKLVIGEATEVVEVTGSAVAINTEQATVQGVLTTEQIENLPINGRNFLDLAQLEPGVQIQDGGNFDPTKNGFSSISFGGRFGRTARIEVDGIDISDETVGTTTQNLPASSIQEFQVSQSSLDMSTELTSSGAVNVVTKSGSNKWHGQGFYLLRDHNSSADIASSNLYFQRNNFGGSLGGPLLKDKLFFFADMERLKQDLSDPVASAGPFSSLTGTFNSPFRDTDGVAKLDYHINDNIKLFGRFSYEQNTSVKGFIPNSFQPFANVNHTPVYVGGLDFNTGTFTHQFRFGFTKFRNGITDATRSGVFNPDPAIEITMGPDPNCLTGGVDSFCSGSNLLAPQETFQENVQFKYDGSKIIGSHILRYGGGLNHIQGGGFAKFFASAPDVNSDPTLNLGPNPLAYPVLTVIMGNGQGFSSEKPAFGLPGGGLGPDNRTQFYFGDSWKIKPNLTLTYGLRYVHDTGRTDSDLGSMPCSTLAPNLAAALVAGGTPCTTNIGDLFGAGLGAPVRDPGLNFAPSFGFAWRPENNAHTVVRGGIGLYYENSIYNNNLFDRPGRLAQGLFLGTAVPCAGGAVNPGFAMPDGSPIPVNLSTICGAPMGSVANQLAALQTAYQAASAAVGASVNGNYLGNSLFASNGVNGISLFAPNYQTPRSVQMNIGFEHELTKGIVWSADYLRNVSTHTLLAVDVNHVGDARFLNKTNALAAISATNAKFGCGTATSAAAINCAITNGAQIGDYAGFGLDSGTRYCGAGPQADCPIETGGATTGAVGAAFAGENPNLGVNQMLFPAGRSVYNAFQTSLRANVAHPFTGVKSMNWQVSYALSRYVSTAQDSDFVNNVNDNNHPAADMGPDGLDRTHQFSFGGSFDLPWYIRFGIIGHVYSPLPLNLRLPPGGAGGIFTSDPTGSGANDGSSSYGGLGGLVPGTSLGAFGRSISPGGLGAFISNYNNTVAGTATPAGQALISNGLFSLAQLQALNGVFPTLDMPTSVQGLGWLKTVDFRLSYPRKIRESMSIEPSISIFNAFNMSNFDAPGLTLNGNLNTGPGSVNGSSAADHQLTRVLPGSGVYDLGAPRVLEFGMKFTF